MWCYNAEEESDRCRTYKLPTKFQLFNPPAPCGYESDNKTPKPFTFGGPNCDCTNGNMNCGNCTANPKCTWVKVTTLMIYIIFLLHSYFYCITSTYLLRVHFVTYLLRPLSYLFTPPTFYLFTPRPLSYIFTPPTFLHIYSTHFLTYLHTYCSYVITRLLTDSLCWFLLECSVLLFARCWVVSFF